MKKLLLLIASIVVGIISVNAQVFSDDFTGLTTGATLVGQSSWTKGGTGPELSVANTTPMLYPNYASGGGEYAVLPFGTSTSSRVYKTFPVVQTAYSGKTFFYSFLLRLNSASDTATAYFMSLGVSGTSTSYGAKLFAKKNGAGFSIGASKTSNTAVFGTSVLNFGTTYLIVVRYTFNAPGTVAPEKFDDVAYLWVNPSNPAEPQTANAEVTVPAAGTDSDMDGFNALADVGNFVWHSRSAANPTGSIDGIRVGVGATSADAWTNLNPDLVSKFDNPAKLIVKNSEAPVVLDGKLDEADWNGAPALLFGNGAFTKKQPGDMTVSGGFDLKAGFKVNNVDYSIPNKDSSWARVRFIRKGMDLFVGVQSNDKSICRFDWEGEGIFLQIKDNAGVTKEYKLYYQNIAGNKDTIKYEESVLNSGAGAGFLPAGSTANDTTNVDNGYSAELRIRLDKLGYTAGVNAVQMSMNIFDPDGFQFNAALPWPYGMSPWDSARGSYYKSWWGSEWGNIMKTLEFAPEVIKYDNPPKLLVKNAGAPVVLDGKLDEGDWSGAPSLLFGNGAFTKKQPGDMTVSGGFDLKAGFKVNNVDYSIPNKDSSWARVKFIRKGMDLFVGVQSNDKSICRFDWEGEGIFLQIKDNAGVTKEYKLYYQNIAANKDTIKYEESVLNSGAGAGFLPAGSTANDTTNVDNGYSAELRIRLDKLGYTAGVNAVQMSMNIFDPDGFQFNAALPWPYGMSPWDSARGSYYKSWWGSEWGNVMQTLEFQTEYDSPDTLMAKISSTAITLDGKLNEADWSTASTLVFGPANAPKTGTEKTVTGGFDLKKNFNVNGVDYSLPYKDTSFTRVKFLAKGNDLYIGIQSPDKSICRFDWEGDGLFMKIKNSIGEDKEYKLYWQNIAGNKDTVKYEETILNSGAGAAFLPAGSTANDTTNVDNGYTAELRVRLDKLGFAPTTAAVDLKVAMTIFDPDGYQFNAALPWPFGMSPWDSARGSYYKSWWGSEWGGVYKTIAFPKTTGVQELGDIPLTFALNQNYPNPFNPSTVIRYSIPAASNVSLKIYNLLGQEVATLVNMEQKPGNYETSFNAGSLSSGVYIYRIQAGTFVETKKMMLLK